MRSVMGQNIVLAEGNNSDNFGKIITLNESAATLWEALKGKSFEPKDAAEVLTATYDIDPATAAEDANYIIERMAEKGLIEK